MGKLDIRLDGGQGGGFAAPVAIEVRNDNLLPVWKGAVRLGASHELTLDDGRYFVRLILPSGFISQTVVVEGSSSAVVQFDDPALHAVSAPGIDLAPSEKAGPWVTIGLPSVVWAASDGRTEAAGSPGLVQSGFPPAAAHADGKGDEFRGVWLRLWVDKGGNWEVAPWPQQSPQTIGRSLQYQFDQLPRSRCYLQIGGPSMVWRLVALPPVSIRILISPVSPPYTGEPDRNTGTATVSVATRDAAAEMLLGYAAAGQSTQANDIKDYLVGNGLLSGKFEDPIAATIAGYFLLNRGALADAHEVWLKNLADHFQWLPDGNVIDAWYRIRQKSKNKRGQNSELTAARDRLVEAAARGIPIYTRGMRLLLDGLSLFESDAKYQTPAVSAAMKLARSYGIALHWQQATTTFTGRDPATPGPAPSGYPESPDNVVFLQPVEEDLRWRFGAAFRHYRTTRTDIDAWLTRAKGDATVASDSESVAAPQKISGSRPPRWRKLPPTIAGLGVTAQAPRDEDPMRLQARLLRASDTQGQAESFGGSVRAIVPSPGGHPVEFTGLAVGRILGKTELVPVGFLERALRAVATVGRVTVLTVDGAIANRSTALLVSPSLVLLDHRVVSDPPAARLAQIEFDYQDGADGALRPGSCCYFDPDRFFITDPALAISVVALAAGQKTIEGRWWSRILADEVKAIRGERLSLIQHDDGRPKQLALRTVQMVGFDDPTMRCIAQGFRPSTGAPLFNDQWEFLGLQRNSFQVADRGGRPSPQRAKGRGQDNASELEWYGCEVTRASRMFRALSELDLANSSKQAELRDELIYGDPALIPQKLPK